MTNRKRMYQIITLTNHIILVSNIKFCYIGTRCFTGKCTTRKIPTKPHPGFEWRIFHILTSEDIKIFDNLRKSSENLRQRSCDLWTSFGESSEIFSN